MFKLERGDTLLFIGDSITDAGRVRPQGEGRGDALGRGYVSIIASFIQAAYPDYMIRIINKGISGNTVRDLKIRWETDVLSYAPDWLSIMIGINDVWRQFDHPACPDLHVYPEEYEATLDELITTAKEYVKKGIILCSPYMIEANTKDSMRQRMDEYREICRQLTKKHDILYVDTQEAFAYSLQYLHPMSLAWDRIHPEPFGHMILARAILNCLGFDWGRGLPNC